LNNDAARQDNMFHRMMADKRIQDMPSVPNGNRQEIWPLHLWTKIAVAASITLVLSIGAVLFLNKPSTPESNIRHTYQEEIEPGSEKARIVLDDGSFIELDKMQDGTVLEGKGMRIVKRNDGTIVYEPTGDQETQQLAYNTIVTPRGGAYSIVLPDGSRVWMNADSRLKYPITFSTDVRAVELDGEAYFEVVQK